MSDEENQETRETAAVPAEEVTFSHTDAESVGDPAAAGTGAEGEAFEVPGAGAGESPAAAQERAESYDESPLERPEVQILGAFVGAFILAKLLQKLFSRD